MKSLFKQMFKKNKKLWTTIICPLCLFLIIDIACDVYSRGFIGGFFPPLTLHLHFLQFHLQFILKRQENLLSGYTHSGAEGFKKLLKSSVDTMSKGQNIKCSPLFFTAALGL